MRVASPSRDPQIGPFSRNWRPASAGRCRIVSIIRDTDWLYPGGRPWRAVVKPADRKPPIRHHCKPQLGIPHPRIPEKKGSLLSSFLRAHAMIFSQTAGWSVFLKVCSLQIPCGFFLRCRRLQTLHLGSYQSIETSEASAVRAWAPAGHACLGAQMQCFETLMAECQ